MGQTETSVLGGAASGAMAGAMFGPYGMAIGAVVGAVGGGVMARQARKQKRAAEKRRQEFLAKQQVESDKAANSIIAGMGKSQYDTSTASMMGSPTLTPGQESASMQGTSLIGNNQTRQTSIIGG